MLDFVLQFDSVGVKLGDGPIDDLFDLGVDVRVLAVDLVGAGLWILNELQFYLLLDGKHVHEFSGHSSEHIGVHHHLGFAFHMSRF